MTEGTSLAAQQDTDDAPPPDESAPLRLLVSDEQGPACTVDGSCS